MCIHPKYSDKKALLLKICVTIVFAVSIILWAVFTRTADYLVPEYFKQLGLMIVAYAVLLFVLWKPEKESLESCDE